MNEVVKLKWVNALRSGHYKQGFGQLKNSKDEYCCLGVLCDIYAITYATSFNEGNNIMPVEKITNWAGLESRQKVIYKNQNRHLADINDDEKLSFKEIAEIIIKQL